MVTVRPLAIPEVLEIVPTRHADARGFFSEVYNRDALAQHGIVIDFVQDNHSLSVETGVLRGLHYQTPPFAQAKLVRVVRGAIFDVAIDIRQGSLTFGHWVGLTLSASAGNQILIPEGFAHGFLTLEPGCEVIYKASKRYSREHDRAIRWDDPQIAIDWPLGQQRPWLSDKDSAAPSLADTPPAFDFGG